MIIKILNKNILKKGIQFFIIFNLILLNIFQCSGENIRVLNDSSQPFTNENPTNFVSADMITYELWNKTYGGTYDDFGYSIEKTSDNGSIIIGYTKSMGAGGSDVWLLKTDSDGNELWNKTFGGTNNDYGCSIKQDADGEYILVGHTESYGLGLSDLWIIKTDSLGNELWNKTYGGTEAESGFSIQHSSDNSYIITGMTSSYGAGYFDVWLLKIDENGNEIWNNTYGGSDQDVAYSVQKTTKDEYILVGRTKSYGNGLVDGWMVKTDSEGNEMWNRTFGGTDYDCIYGVNLTYDGGFVLIGNTVKNESSDLWLIKTNSKGLEEWNKTFGGSGSDLGYTIQSIANSNFIITGYTSSYGAGDLDAWILKVDSSGNELYNKTFGGKEDDRFYSSIKISNNEYLFTGYTNSYGSGGKDVWLLKFKDQSKSKITFLFGYVTNLTNYGNITKFKSKNLIYVNFRPFNFGSFSYGEEIIVRQVLAVKIKENPSMIIGFYRFYY